MQIEDIKNPENHSVDIHEILKYLPHRYPFLLVDRVISCEPGKDITALKNVTINEPFFGGHFPHYPVMPGVLIIEALAQAAAILTLKTVNRQTDESSLYYFVGIDGARFKKPAAGRPTDTQGNDICGNESASGSIRSGRKWMAVLLRRPS